TFPKNRAYKYVISDIVFRDKEYGWRSFGFGLSYEEGSPMNRDELSDVNFRDKNAGWKNYTFTLHFKQNSHIEHDNVFMTGFINKFFQRRSCHNCPVKCLKSGSDITLGDYWDIRKTLPEFDDDKGVSLVMLNTQKGEDFFNGLNVIKRETTYTDALTNKMIEESSIVSKKRSVFFKHWKKKKLAPLVKNLTFWPRMKYKFISSIKTILKQTGLYTTAKAVLRKR
ncbi:MAG: Coenzyme F420 hydrogenase/dehydrogenase, beta subunit C-terminal domain, partial [Treponema sp.]|nr:Coenzyme F420 hydrogenase/dehydrogenase, beta subunit C-terminal domain [Treponema sp.]